MKHLSYPSAVVFDLDYTLWPFWCDTHITLPLKVISYNKLVDRYGFRISLYKDVESVFSELESNNVVIIGASRTAAPHIAREILSLIYIGEKPMIKYFHSLQWGQGSKIRHIKKAAEQLGLEEELHKGKFILFDDEYRNKDVTSINCEFVHVSEEFGLTREYFEKGVHIWSKTKDPKKK